MAITAQDRSILRELAGQLAEIAALPIQRERADMWRKLNRLEKVKPMISIYQIPWHEMNGNGELDLQTTDEVCRRQETHLRQVLYQWRHMPGDMVVEPVLYSPLVVRDTGFGIHEDVDVVRTDQENPVVSRHFHLQIQEEADIEKIKMPVVTYDAEATERHYDLMCELYDGIMPIVKRGTPGFWFAPWDELIRWWGVQEAMTDMVLRPELVHHAMDRLVSAYLCRLDQYEQQGLLALNNGNNTIGSGGLGYTDELPQPDYDPQHVRALDLWGNATPQIFSEVSPAMHEEFALQYERRWLQRFGLTYYGCCEPLHHKVAILRSVPNLRKISMSPWINLEKAVKNVGTDYVFSRKPNPAIFAEDVWHPERAREELQSAIEATRGCIVEVILKDISTVRYQPERLWAWAEMAREVTEAVAP